jgi:hypothetical protein
MERMREIRADLSGQSRRSGLHAEERKDGSVSRLCHGARPSGRMHPMQRVRLLVMRISLLAGFRFQWKRSYLYSRTAAAVVEGGLEGI